MTSSISGTSDDAIQLMMQQMFQKMKSADADGLTGLSKTEIASIDAGENAGGIEFLKSLQDQFDALDADKDGQLSADEISSVQPVEQMGLPPGMTIESDAQAQDDNSGVNDLLEALDSSDDTENAASSSENLMKELMDSFKESFIETFEADSQTSEGGSESGLKSAFSSIVSEADSNSDGSVSVEELSSIEDPKLSELSEKLLNNFSNYDSDGNKSISEAELKSAMSSPEVLSGAEKLGSSLGSLSGSFVQKLLNTYNAGSLSTLASSFSAAV